MPDLFGQADGLQEMDVRPWQPSRVRPGEGIERHFPLRVPAQLAATRLADMHFALRQAREDRQPGIKRLTLRQDNRLRVGAERVGVHGGDENGGRHGIGHRGFAERTGTQRRPQARFKQLRLHSLAGECGQIGDIVAGKLALPIAFQPDHHRLQHPTLAAMDSHDRPAGGCGKQNAGIFYSRIAPGP